MGSSQTAGIVERAKVNIETAMVRPRSLAYIPFPLIHSAAIHWEDHAYKPLLRQQNYPIFGVVSFA